MTSEQQSDLESTKISIPYINYSMISYQDSKKLFEHYKGSGKRKKTHPNTLNQMKINSRGIINNLNPFILCFLQSPKEKRKNNGISLSTPPLDRIGYTFPKFEDLAKTLKEDPQYLRNLTIDFALALRSIEGPNQILAEDLADQINAKYGSVKLPMLISLRGTMLKQLPGSNYDSLGFKITEDTQIIEAPILNQPGYFLHEDINEKTCLPGQIRTERKTGDLEFITNKTGLTRAYINIYGDIDCGHSDLGITDYSGRLFVIRK